jgi:uncharacterized membrane protein YphA (DoxX/SURF4 family)
MRKSYSPFPPEQAIQGPPTEERDIEQDRFFLAILLAVTGVSFLAGLHELDQLLALAAPAAVLSFLTLMAGALGAAVLAAAGVRRFARVALVLLLLGYALLFATSWYRFVTEPDMFEQQDYEQSASYQPQPA